MTFQCGFRGWIRGKAVARAAQIGTLLFATLCWNCGAGDGGPGALSGSGGALDPDRGVGGSATGGGGGTESTGGAGGDSSGGSGGSASGGSGNEGEGKACPGQAAPVFAEGLSCRNQSDCGSGECRSEYIDTSGVCGACFALPNACNSGGGCGDGMACVPAPSDLIPCQCPGQSICVAGCTGDSCPEGYLCGSNSQCTPGSCETDGYVCPTGETCDPERALAAHGCVPLSCEGEGYECAENQICDAGASGVDSHGCRRRKCDEGLPCEGDRVCDAGATDADSLGCRESSCATDGYECAEGFVCDPGATSAQSHGCRRILCTEGAECPVNTECADSGVCARRSCASDADCECGVCVLGSCQERFFYCVSFPS